MVVERGGWFEVYFGYRGEGRDIRREVNEEWEYNICGKERRGMVQGREQVESRILSKSKGSTLNAYSYDMREWVLISTGASKRTDR
jgi:hypothetical protein